MPGNVNLSLEAYSEFIAVAVLIGGVVLAHLARIGCARGLTRLDQWLAQHSASSSSALSPALIRRFSMALFWLLVLLTVFVALRMLGVGGFSSFLEEVVQYVPRVIVALAIVGAGHLLGLLCRGLIVRLGPELTPDSPIPRLVHASILVVALLMALQHVGIDTSFVTELLLVLLGLTAGGMVLAFAFGARAHVANLIGRTELTRYAIGDRIRIDGAEGEIVEIHRTGVVIATAEGTVAVPASRFSEMSVVRLEDLADAG